MTDKPKAKRNYPFRGKIYTAEQIDNMISGIEIDAYTKTETNTLLAQKQNVLTAGDGISIENDTISALIDSSDWILHNSVDWSTLFYTSETDTNKYTKYDTIIKFTFGNRVQLYFIPKNFKIKSILIAAYPLYLITNPNIELLHLETNLLSLLNAGPSISITRDLITLNSNDNTITLDTTNTTISKKTDDADSNGIRIFYKP